MPIAKRKREAAGDSAIPPAIKRRSSTRTNGATIVNPDVNEEILDGPNALRASPDADPNPKITSGKIKQEKVDESDSALSDVPPAVAKAPVKKARKTKKQIDADQNGDADVEVKKEDAGEVKKKPAKVAKKSDEAMEDPEADDEEEEVGEEAMLAAARRPPPINSDYLPLPWKGRLGYACLNTYLRQCNPPIFSSRTCRIQSILEHRHPLQDPSQPEHPTKNRPDKNKPADIALGQKYLEDICLANVRDIAKMIRWNERYHIRFLRLSSEMFPFASHPEYGYKLASFAAEALAEAGKVIAQFGHRVTTHPGQFTQLGSPRRPVIENAIRDLEYHDEMLSLLKLPEQLNRDAVMILHMGGLFEGKEETLARFREEYAKLSQSIKNRLVLENDDVIWTVHDLLPICEELNIPMVLDYHHHNIMFDADQIREGTKDIMDLYPRIKATWDRKGIKQKMHYSEPTPPAITGRQRRKHSPRVATLPPCAPDMDLMIEAKDKEQAVLELMRTFKLPGYGSFSDIIPYVRSDDNKAAMAILNKKPSKKNQDEDPPKVDLIPEEDIGMGGPEGRVYWPPTMEEWLRPKKREVKKKDPEADAGKKSKAQIKKEATEAYNAREAEKKAAKNDGPIVDSESDVDATPATKKAKAAMRKKEREKAAKAEIEAELKAEMTAQDSPMKAPPITKSAAKAQPKSQPKTKSKVKAAKNEEPAVLTPSSSGTDGEESLDLHDGDESDEDPVAPPPVKRSRTAPAVAPLQSTRPSAGRRARSKPVIYTERSMEEE